MNHFEDLVSRKNGRISVKDLGGYKKIGEGSDGFIFQLTPEKCIKIFKRQEAFERELFAYQAGESSSIIPTLYEYGQNYIVMEYINGPSLKNYLINEKELSESIARKLIFMLDEFKRIGFTRQDTQLRHIFINELEELKIIDHKRAFSRKRNTPVRLLEDLKKVGFLDEFLKHVKMINSALYNEWKGIKN